MRWLSEQDKGLYDAMNKGIRMATGDIVGIINLDDLFAEPTAVWKIVKSFVEHQVGVNAVYADLYYVARNDASKIVRHWISGIQHSFRYGWHPTYPTFYVRREIYQKYGLFDLEFKFAADFELMLKLIERHHIKLFVFFYLLPKLKQYFQ